MRMSIVGAIGGLALLAAPVVSASTIPNSHGKAVVEQQTARSKLAQNQDSKQKGQLYNKQDTSKRRSWGGG
jgi:hypothetical protein